MRGSAILTERISGDRLAEVRRLLLDVYAEVYRDALDDGFHSVERFDERLGGYAARPGWEAVVGYDEGQPLGYAFGAPLPAQARWWVDVHPPLDADYVTETGDRTFALFELMVRKPWRGTGAARRLHDELVDGRQESRITLLVDSEHPRSADGTRNGGTAASARPDPSRTPRCIKPWSWTGSTPLRRTPAAGLAGRRPRDGQGGPLKGTEQGLWLWIANQRLAIALDEMYAEDPSARPTDDEVERAAAALRP